MEAELMQQTDMPDVSSPASGSPHSPTGDAAGATRAIHEPPLGKQRLSRYKDRARKRRQLQELRKRLVPAGA